MESCSIVAEYKRQCPSDDRCERQQLVQGKNGRVISVISSNAFGDAPSGPFQTNENSKSSILLYYPSRTTINDETSDKQEKLQVEEILSSSTTINNQMIREVKSTNREDSYVFHNRQYIIGENNFIDLQFEGQKFLWYQDDVTK